MLSPINIFLRGVQVVLHTSLISYTKSVLAFTGSPNPWNKATSTHSNFYTGLKFGSKTHFYGRVAPEGILAITYEKHLFTAAERPKRILVSKCTFTDPFGAIISYKNCYVYLYFLMVGW